MESECWGEIIDNKSCIKVPTFNINDEASMPKEIHVKPEKFYFHSKTVTPPVKVSDAIPCERTLHTVELLKYRSTIKLIIETLREDLAKLETNLRDLKIGNMQKKIQQMKYYCEDDIDSKLCEGLNGEGLIIPDFPPSPIFKMSSDNPESDFIKGKCKPPAVISSQVAWKILWKSVATLLCHAGYESATDIVLDVLTDVVQERIQKMCISLARHTHNKPYPEPSVFPDSMKRLYQELGIEEMQEIGDFYNKQVIEYHNDILDNCNHLKNECIEIQKCIASTRAKYLNLFKVCLKEEIVSGSHDAPDLPEDFLGSSTNDSEFNVSFIPSSPSTSRETVIREEKRRKKENEPQNIIFL